MKYRLGRVYTLKRARECMGAILAEQLPPLRKIWKDKVENELREAEKAYKRLYKWHVPSGAVEFDEVNQRLTEARYASTTANDEWLIDLTPRRLSDMNTRYVQEFILSPDDHAYKLGRLFFSHLTPKYSTILVKELLKHAPSSR